MPIPKIIVLGNEALMGAEEEETEQSSKNKSLFPSQSPRRLICCFKKSGDASAVDTVSQSTTKTKRSNNHTKGMHVGENGRNRDSIKSLRAREREARAFSFHRPRQASALGTGSRPKRGGKKRTQKLIDFLLSPSDLEFLLNGKNNIQELVRLAHS